MSKFKDMKVEQVADIKSRIEKASAFLVINYQGLTVAQDTELRNEFRKNGVTYSVYKNRLVARALDELGITGFEEALNGPSAFAMSESDVVAPAKVVQDKQKAFKKLEIKCGLIDGKFCDRAECEALANIPNRETLLAMLVGIMQAPIAGAARAIKAIADQQEA